MTRRARPATDADGYLLDPDDWDETFALETAAALGVTMTEEHWDVVRFMRAEREEHGVSPDARHVMRHLAETRGAPRNRLFELFPYGYPGQACRIAGMKRPRVWSTG
ncbi:TusE/DsrC/DsvC family sulfur relay protein [Pinisolibacter aquiterrae]|uniref:TusE/DsrC/DsvC family sulfur relay protein n=1 Tax=Pinisolibacter aquiterrae TaxID=2815579 RepID=UPI001C3D986B|nr:TusE/DsrC/DsvC family sulfur relay protein [Pinisolibacter aquiterrae]MCC8234460.1 TusE/DsrC/DsvC family sulfur relay protein [Pinisolibacter aquiterrae]